MLLWKIWSVDANINEKKHLIKNKEIIIHDKGVFMEDGFEGIVTYEGAYFNTLSTNLQHTINEFLRKNILFEETINMIYFISLNREVYKYIHYLKTIMEGFAGNIDQDLNKLNLEI